MRLIQRLCGANHTEARSEAPLVLNSAIERPHKGFRVLFPHRLAGLTPTNARETLWEREDALLVMETIEAGAIPQ